MLIADLVFASCWYVHRTLMSIACELPVTFHLAELSSQECELAMTSQTACGEVSLTTQRNLVLTWVRIKQMVSQALPQGLLPAEMVSDGVRLRIVCAMVNRLCSVTKEVQCC